MLTGASGFGYGPETGSCVTGNEHSNVLRSWAAVTQGFWLSPQCSWGLRSSWMLRSVSGKFYLSTWDILFLNVGNELYICVVQHLKDRILLVCNCTSVVLDHIAGHCQKQIQSCSLLSLAVFITKLPTRRTVATPVRHRHTLPPNSELLMLIATNGQALPLNTYGIFF
jgi:hypothetical protein